MGVTFLMVSEQKNVVLQPGQQEWEYPGLGSGFPVVPALSAQPGLARRDAAAVSAEHQPPDRPVCRVFRAAVTRRRRFDLLVMRSVPFVPPVSISGVSFGEFSYADFLLF